MSTGRSGDILWQVRGRERTYASELVWRLLYQPVCGRRISRSRPQQAVDRVTGHWRRQVARLQWCGSHFFDGDKQRFARNCKPAGVQLEQDWLRVCRQRICPYCYARQYVDLWAKLRIALAGGEVAVAVYSVLYGDPKSEYDEIPTDDDLDPTWLGEQLVSRHFPSRQAIRRRFPRGGGCYAIHVWPELLPRDQQFAVLGCWRARHTYLTMVPADWQPFQPQRGKLEVIRAGDPSRLLSAFASAYSYPRAWLFAPPSLMTAMLAAGYRRNFHTTYGALRR